MVFTDIFSKYQLLNEIEKQNKAWKDKLDLLDQFPVALEACQKQLGVILAEVDPDFRFLESFYTYQNILNFDYTDYTDYNDSIYVWEPIDQSWGIVEMKDIIALGEKEGV